MDRVLPFDSPSFSILHKPVEVRYPHFNLELLTPSERVQHDYMGVQKTATARMFRIKVLGIMRMFQPAHPFFLQEKSARPPSHARRPEDETGVFRPARRRIARLPDGKLLEALGIFSISLRKCGQGIPNTRCLNILGGGKEVLIL